MIYSKGEGIALCWSQKRRNNMENVGRFCLRVVDKERDMEGFGLENELDFGE